MKLDPYESELLDAYQRGKLKSVASKAELTQLKASARATAIKDRRVNIRLSSGVRSKPVARRVNKAV